MGSIAHHAGELSIAAVGSWLAVPTKSRNFGKVEPELVLQPADSISGTASQDGDKIVAGEVTSLWADSVMKGPYVGVRHGRISLYLRRRSWNCPGCRGLADSEFQHH